MSVSILEVAVDDRPVRVDHVEIWDKLDKMHTEVRGIADAVGKPGTVDGGVPATGIFAHLNAHNTRIKKFERAWERGIGVAAGACPLIIVLWWLAGDRIAALLR